MKLSDSMELELFGLRINCTAMELKGISIMETKRFRLFNAELYGKNFIVAEYLGEPLGAVQMYDILSGFTRLSGIDVLVYLHSITYYMRAAYMEKGIPFVVRDKQVFVPFLGMSLTKRCDTERNTGVNSRLRFSTQLLLLWYLHSDKETLSLSEANKAIAYSRMTLSRSGRELVETGLFEAAKAGNGVVLRGVMPKREIFEKLLDRMVSPDKFIGYATIDRIDGSYTYGGKDALAQRSMLGTGQIPEYATSNREIDVQRYYVNDDNVVKVYQWKYDPLLFSTDQYIDSLSVAISLKNEKDERVQACIEEMLDEFWKGRENV